MKDLWKFIVSMLLPPLTVDATTRWRLSISFMAMSIIVLFFGHVAWAMGVIPGLEGFARTSELTQQGEKIDSIIVTQDEILVRIVASTIEDARVRQCTMLNSGQSEGAEGWSRTLTASLSEYRDKTGREYQLRPCNEY